MSAYNEPGYLTTHSPMNSHHGYHGPSDYHDGAYDGDADVHVHVHARGYPHGYGYGYDDDVHDDADVDDGGHYYDDDDDDDYGPSLCLQ